MNILDSNTHPTLAEAEEFITKFHELNRAAQVIVMIRFAEIAYDWSYDTHELLGKMVNPKNHNDIRRGHSDR